MPSMEEVYASELRGREPETVDTLFLDNTQGGVIGGINEKLTKLELLSMVKCGLTTLKGMPVLPALNYLDLSDNELGDDASFDVLIKCAPEIKKITLSGNRLTLDNVRTLKMLPNLMELDLSNNSSLGLLDDYRVKMFEMIPSLKILDGCDVDGEEVEEEFAAGEGAEDSDEGDSDEDGPGLSYLNKSQFSDDETDDYVVPEAGDAETRGAKRAASADCDEPEAKKSAE
ncbi:Acidic leucine-rich nuclear phosphoprotein 32-related protein 2 [Caenorhabditis elegans]|nr:Acidic leucine-rich nuclear phosphoprotein 32-related protein 2 [Caenorhabditis elegans]CCD66998.2 Acidic leucine-rich nuclear phosphoprotein 32-related protein 2 [Caenorhabditis elegans]|eukprot:NP_504310.2 Acidic leucine-rich nuclear phosphoprotein 32-related protein 2 [Caenorhabditis elegans]